eukprot:7344676-Lingulodinium_polyedra.AAC.1
MPGPQAGSHAPAPASKPLGQTRAGHAFLAEPRAPGLRGGRGAFSTSPGQPDPGEPSKLSPEP